jgi:hypothetical protein
MDLRQKQERSSKHANALRLDDSNATTMQMANANGKCKWQMQMANANLQSKPPTSFEF